MKKFTSERQEKFIRHRCKTLELNELFALMDERQRELFLCDCEDRVKGAYPVETHSRQEIELAHQHIRFAAWTEGAWDARTFHASPPSLVSPAEKAWRKQRAIWYLCDEEYDETDN